MQFFKITYHSTVPPQERDLAVVATKTQYRNLNCKTTEEALYFENLRLEQNKNEWKAVKAEVVTVPAKGRAVGVTTVFGNKL